MNKVLIIKCYLTCLFYLLLFLLMVLNIDTTYLDVLIMITLYTIILGDIRNPLYTYSLDINSIDLLTNSLALLAMYKISVICSIFALPFIIIDMVINIYRIKFNMKEELQ